jgi:hypothetical protein
MCELGSFVHTYICEEEIFSQHFLQSEEFHFLDKSSFSDFARTGQPRQEIFPPMNQKIREKLRSIEARVTR